MWCPAGRGLLRSAWCVACAIVLYGCGGGGAGGGAGAAPPPALGSSLNGTVTDDASPSPAAIAGAAVTVYPAGVVLRTATPLAQATTAPNGTWSIGTGPAPGAYLLQITPPDSAHATLHKAATLTAGANAVGVTRLTILSTTEQQCIADFNQQRNALGVSTLSVDNAAMIAARAEAQAIAAWNGQGSAPAVAPMVYANAGGLGSSPSTVDSGASDCTMATSNMFNPAWGNRNPYSVNTNPKATWFGFGIAPDPIGNSDYAAAVAQYP